MPDGKKSILNLNKLELSDYFESIHEKPFRATQVLEWIYSKKCLSFEEMSNLGKSLRQKLKNSFEVVDAQILQILESRSGTRKYIIQLRDQNVIESVYLRHKDHYTLCLSSQVGCILGCKFCATARLGAIRNLSASEILSQVLLMLADNKESEKGNLVFMGMGEPLLNTDNVCRSIDAMISDWGMNWSPRRITVSTSGVIPEIRRFFERITTVNLAVSLNAADNNTRKRLMPISAKYPLDQLIESLKNLPLITNQQKITIEYVMINNINDSIKDAGRLVKLLDPRRFKLNLIPLNKIVSQRYKPPEDDKVAAFQKLLSDNGYIVRIRKSEGSDISAACGQLAGLYPNKINEDFKAEAGEEFSQV